MPKKRIRWVNLGASKWEANLDGVAMGYAVKTGTHLDDYPWDWYLTDEGEAIAATIERQSRERTPVAETLRSAKSYIRQALGLTTDED